MLVRGLFLVQQLVDLSTQLGGQRAGLGRGAQLGTCRHQFALGSLARVARLARAMKDIR
ncbi:MAG: hypothetical protein QOK25_896, partial [Thermoleophilaceae bacterium]|nr:hypothetical protein [Thermoleophilaceae bacterium]